MKTIKNLFGVVLLVMLTTSVFANPFLPKKQENPFSKLKYYSLTTSYTVHIAWQDRGPNGTVIGGVPYHDYTQYLYITDTATPGRSNRITLPGDFTATGDYVVGPYTFTNVSRTIFSGTSYQAEPYNGLPPSLTFSVISGSVTLSANTYNGLPIYFDYTVEHYY